MNKGLVQYKLLQDIGSKTAKCIFQKLQAVHYGCQGGSVCVYMYVFQGIEKTHNLEKGRGQIIKSHCVLH